MKVYFRSGWLAPGAVFYKASADRKDLRDVPNELEKRLPKSAKVISREPVPADEGADQDDPARAGMRAFKEAIHADDGKNQVGLEAAKHKGADPLKAAAEAVARAEEAAANQPRKGRK